MQINFCIYAMIISFAISIVLYLISFWDFAVDKSNSIILIKIDMFFMSITLIFLILSIINS